MLGRLNHVAIAVRDARAAASVSPRCSSSITTDQNVPTGFARPLPMMSNAEPWIGSNIDG